ncbi:MAG: transporter substrate-binding domain-containing protein [Phormidesmis sp. RL_2_1]|nr:transporter substrate-binding domain-containing protein [Phormidesmis sp. RL_2_1]
MRHLFTSLSFILGAQLLLPPIFVLGNRVTSPRAVAAELAEIRDRGYITIAVKNNRAPLGFIDDQGHLTGYEIDIARRLAAELLGDASALRLVPVRNQDRLRAVLDDQVDIAIAAITITAARRRIVSFSHPYYLDGVGFITYQPPQATQPTIQALSDLRLSTIAMLDRSSTVPHVRYILPGAQLVGVSSYREGQRLLIHGEVDAFAGDLSVLAGWLSPNDTPYTLLPSFISAEPLSVAMPKGLQYRELNMAINQALQRWYEEGWLQERAAYWGLPAESSQFVNLASESPASCALAQSRICAP